jgi:alpha-L-fucosidase
MIGAYSSKADWSSEDYWWPYFATPDRHVNYDPAKHPERWNRFKEFTYRQIEELMTGYGTVDILWLDGGWVRPLGNIPKRFEWWAKKGSWNQDIDIERIAVMARTHQPGLIIVDRTVAGRFENYVTPEGSVPDDPIPVPWETCLTMGIGQWAFKPNQQFLPARILVHLLVDNVSKGGNLLLNIGPGPDGDWPDTAYARLKEIGDWMRVNSEAIHGTRSMTPYRDGRVRFTRQKNSATVYAVYLGDEHEGAPPARVVLNSFRPDRGASITMLGVEGELRWQGHEGGCTIEIPESVRNNPPCVHAWVIRISR